MRETDQQVIVVEKLRWLRLPGMASSLPMLLERAYEKNMTALDALSELADEEKASRRKSAVKRRIDAARFPELNTVDEFDFNFDPVCKRLKTRWLPGDCTAHQEWDDCETTVILVSPEITWELVYTPTTDCAIGQHGTLAVVVPAT